MLPFCAVIPVLGHVIEQARSALDAPFRRGVHQCLYNGTVTSLRQLEIQPSPRDIFYFHSSITLLIYSRSPPSADFPGFC